MSEDGKRHHGITGLATKAIHAGYRPDPATGAVNTPIYASSTFAQDGVGGLRGGFEYARTGNPTRAALEPRWRPSKTAPSGGRSVPGWPPPTVPCGRCCGPAITWSSRRRLRRHLPADRQGLHSVGRRVHAGGAVRPGRRARRDHAADPADLGGNTDQSAAVHRRYRRPSPNSANSTRQKCWWTTPLPRPRCSSR